MSARESGGISRLVRISVFLTLLGTVFMLIFLMFGFRPWTVGVGVFIGLPLTLVAMITYVVAVIRDLRRREVL